MPFFKFLVYEQTDGYLLELIATFRDEDEAKRYCAWKKLEAKRRKSGVKKDYILKEWKEDNEKKMVEAH